MPGATTFVEASVASVDARMEKLWLQAQTTIKGYGKAPSGEIFYAGRALCRSTKLATSK